MTATMKKVVYKAFGLHISSEIDLPETQKIKLENKDIDIVVEIADLTKRWEVEAESNRYFLIKENVCMFMVQGVAIYLIQDGNRIIVSPMVNAQEDQIRLYLLGTCMGAALMQRKILPLHGSAIAIDGKAYAIVGDSGAGKSTLASAFLNRGYQLLSDDVIPVTLSSDCIPIVTPAYPQQKLWMESLDQFGMDSRNYQPIIKRENKFAIPVAAQFASEPMPLAGIFEIVKVEDQKVTLHPIKKMERFLTLYRHTYRNFFIGDSGLMDWHFNTSAKIVNKMNLYQLRRPISRFTAHELAELMLMTIKKEDILYESN
ncbi:aldolase [Peribacillus loiseleuriae]|uniref:Aldolase n=1 Tax=Peribacillus loiseleuriae TaxID=1679170 RepID=A0A0K9GZ27_9BACI|nr:aldolase [Peribacillus loiseleuriae]KMY51876.1 aldolase [Peribacillus loiseleuriae]